MKYYICGRKKWICGVPAYKGKEFVELYRKFLKLINDYMMIPVPLVRSEERLGDIISKIHLYE